MSYSDCRTRTISYSQRANIRRRSSKGTSFTIGNRPEYEGDPIRIFEHCRYDPAEVQEELDQTTSLRFPPTFKEVEEWIDDLVETGLKTPNATATTSSSIKILFLDEKQCLKRFGEASPLTTLLPKLEIHDWCTAHYMSTFARFPIPLDFEGDDDLQDAWKWRYTISHPFDWDMLWIYLPYTRTTLGIMRTWFDGYNTCIDQLEAEITSFPGTDLANPSLLGLLALQVLTSDAMANVRQKGNRIYEAQKLTGFHKYDRMRDTDEQESEENFRTVIKTVIGATSNLTGWREASIQLSRFAKFIQDENRRYLDNTAASQTRSTKRLGIYITEQAQKLTGDADGAYHDIRAWLSTGEFLLQGVLNLLKQQENKVKMVLAEDQRRIADETKRDSTSMAGIAVVTMVFLPGTFTASFFALPFLANEIQTNGLKQFWIYWVVTIPLTILTLLVWVVWIRHRAAGDPPAIAINLKTTQKIDRPSDEKV